MDNLVNNSLRKAVYECQQQQQEINASGIEIFACAMVALESCFLWS